MISPVCSEKRRISVYDHSRLTILRQFWLLPVLSLLFFLLCLPLSLQSQLASEMIPPANKEQFYYLYQQDSRPYLLIGTPALGVIFALCLFGFLFRSRACGAYFSLGVCRSRLFWQRFSFGALSLTLGVLVGSASSFIINLLVVGYGSRLLPACLLLTALLLLAALVPYALCVVVCTLCGTLGEGMVYTGLLLAAPHLLAWAAGSLLRMLLPGSPFDASNTPMMPAQWGEGPYLEQLTSHKYVSSLFQQSDAFGPALFAAHPINMLNAVPSKGIPWEPPSPLLLLGWTAVAAGASLLAWRLFLRRPGEWAGTAGRSRLLGTASSILLGLAAFSLPLYLNLPTALRLLMAAAAFAGVWFLTQLAAFRGVKRMKRLWHALPASLGTALVLSVILATGGLGFSSRIPALEDIATAEITYRGNPLFGKIIQGSRIAAIYDMNIVSAASREDVKTVCSLHKSLIDMGRPAVTGKPSMDYGDTAIKETIALWYTLKDGSTMVRVYDHVTLDFLEKLLVLDETQGIRQNIEDTLRQIVSQPMALLPPLAPDESETTPLPYGVQNTLLECLTTDLEEQTLEDRYFPQESALAVLLFDGRYPSKIPLTAAFSRTLTFLKEQGLYPPADSTPSFISATFTLAKDQLRGRGKGFYLEGYSYRTDYSDRRDGEVRILIKELKSLLPTLAPSLRTVYYATRPMVQVELEYQVVEEAVDPMNGKSTGQQKVESRYLVRYIPLDELPADLQQKLMTG